MLYTGQFKSTFTNFGSVFLTPKHWEMSIHTFLLMLTSFTAFAFDYLQSFWLFICESTWNNWFILQTFPTAPWTKFLQGNEQIRIIHEYKTFFLPCFGVRSPPQVLKLYLKLTLFLSLSLSLSLSLYIYIYIYILVGLVVSMSDYCSWGRGFNPRHFRKF